jgi:hypothetical protein
MSPPICISLPTPNPPYTTTAPVTVLTAFVKLDAKNAGEISFLVSLLNINEESPTEVI